VLPKRNISPAPLNPLLKAKNAIRSNLSAAGANEVLTYSFVNGDLLKKAGQNPGNAYKIANALSPDLQYYRISLIPSLLDKAYPNLRAGHDKFAIFELGKSHALSNGEDENRLPKEFNLTCFLITASDKLKITQPAYYLAKKYLENLSGRPLLYKPLKEPMTDFDIAKPFEPKRSSAVYVKETNEFLGLVGELKPSIRKNFKLPRFTSGFEVDTLVLQKLLSSPIDYVPMPRFPKVIQDVTLQVNNELSYQELFELVSSKVDELKPENTHFSLSPLDIFQREDLKDTKNVTLRLEIASYDRTLTDTEVNDLLDKVSDEAKNSLDATRQ
jgi:phenylalanyl-tRNA synthetase beta chain